jgi:hypothetical protein
LTHYPQVAAALSPSLAMGSTSTKRLKFHSVCVNAFLCH